MNIRFRLSQVPLFCFRFELQLRGRLKFIRLLIMQVEMRLVVVVIVEISHQTISI